MKLNNVEMGEFDIYDMESAEKYEKAVELLDDLQDIKGSMSESIKKQCETIFDFFNIIFGDGSDKKIFGEKVNLKICVRTLGDFLLYVNDQQKEIEKINNKYSLDRIKR